MARILHVHPRSVTKSSVKNRKSVSEQPHEKAQNAGKVNEGKVNEVEVMDKQQPLELTPDYMGEDRHELVAKLAYQLWEQRGRPVGSPEVDWYAAERDVYSSLVQSGLITPSASDREHMAERIYT